MSTLVHEDSGLACPCERDPSHAALSYCCCCCCWSARICSRWSRWASSWSARACSASALSSSISSSRADSCLSRRRTLSSSSSLDASSSSLCSSSCPAVPSSSRCLSKLCGGGPGRFIWSTVNTMNNEVTVVTDASSASNGCTCMLGLLLACTSCACLAGSRSHVTRTGVYAEALRTAHRSPHITGGSGSTAHDTLAQSVRGTVYGCCSDLKQPMHKNRRSSHDVLQNLSVLLADSMGVGERKSDAEAKPLCSTVKVLAWLCAVKRNTAELGLEQPVHGPVKHIQSRSSVGPHDPVVPCPLSFKLRVPCVHKPRPILAHVLPLDVGKASIGEQLKVAVLGGQALAVNVTAQVLPAGTRKWLGEEKVFDIQLASRPQRVVATAQQAALVVNVKKHQP
eukprot:m.241756 g.241756  ORF g.241756 m.241756 type:complete len:396 (-) comp19004_c0_seq5:640-1827(-)